MIQFIADLNSSEKSLSLMQNVSLSLTQNADVSLSPAQNADVLTDITSKCTDSLMCHICGKQFAHSSSLYRHRKVHPGLSSGGSISCREKHCTFSCRTLQDLRKHLQCVHNKHMDEEIKDFDTFEGIFYAEYVMCFSTCA